MKSNPSAMASLRDKSLSSLESMDYRGTIEQEARKNGIPVYYHDPGAQRGRSDLGGRRIFIPTPHLFPSFFTGLHEIGHLASNHHSWDGKPGYLWEYEAFDRALNCCRDKEINVPHRTINYERRIRSMVSQW